MTPKQKAIQLHEDICKYHLCKGLAKKFATLTVEEILRLSYFDENRNEDDDLYRNYWLQVLSEIAEIEEI